jgi:pyruvate dehydrogenase E2 component (dihydrolipoamide acetyltransferase)
VATDVVMPQMGESIAEGTIVRWIKKVGDAIERDEPLFEISTDKVDAEIPAPAAGVLTEIRAREGETVPVNTVVAVIGETGAGPAAPGPPVHTQSADTPITSPVATARSTPANEHDRQRSSPLVRSLAKEHNVDISRIRGTGAEGRVTKGDFMGFLAASQGAHPSAGPSGSPAPPVPGTVVPMTPVRKKIAEHMVLSRRVSAHVHSVFEVEFTRVDEIRRARKAEYERAGTKLTYLPFIVKAAAAALRAVSAVNASVDGDNVVYHRDVNIGIAVALDGGLIVPVVRHADEKNLLDVGLAIADLAARARSKQLKPDEVTGGTFTVTNPGMFGALFGMPIINQPQVAILGVGSVEKRPVVRDDAVVIRPMAYLSLGFDHRVIDGAVGDQFMAHVKHTLEHWDAGDV